MGRVARVVPADHDHEVEPLGDQLEHRVLPVLRRRANRVEAAEVVGQRRFPIASHHAAPQLGRDGERLVREHGRLVRHADALEVVVGVEAR